MVACADNITTRVVLFAQNVRLGYIVHNQNNVHCINDLKDKADLQLRIEANSSLYNNVICFTRKVLRFLKKNRKANQKADGIFKEQSFFGFLLDMGAEMYYNVKQILALQHKS